MCRRSKRIKDKRRQQQMIKILSKLHLQNWTGALRRVQKNYGRVNVVVKK